MKFILQATLSALLLLSLSACENSSKDSATQNHSSPKTTSKKPNQSSTGSTNSPSSNPNDPI